MMHWLAFNWLYSECGNEYEWENIQFFCRKNLRILSTFDAFNTDEIKIFEQKPVMNGKTANVGVHQKKRFVGVNNKDIENLIMTLYQVRCNLFHGSKSLHNPRDVDLVRASSVILEGYLCVLLKSTDKS
ncbi:MAG: hypothetical protein VB076_11435 [Synergistaceae bacterium]|nr:hypothetical protein [Synergistaceae bacterium]